MADKDKNSKNKGEQEEEKKLLKQQSSLKNLQIKKGDYSIHVLVEKVMNLVTVNDS